MSHPFEDRYFNEKPFLTAEKCIGRRAGITKEYIKKHKAYTCVLTFCGNLKNVLNTMSENVVELDYMNAGEDQHPIYAIDNILFTVPYVGGACATNTIEELKCLGVKKFLACGSAGLIDENFDEKKMFVVTEAIRDEGASYHYAPADVKAITNKRITKIIEEVFIEKNIDYEKGVVWTTDGFYRETPSLINKRISEGAVAVDMECSAWCISSQVLGVEFGQFLYFSDSVSNLDWNLRDKQVRENIKDAITMLAYEIAKKM